MSAESKSGTQNSPDKSPETTETISTADEQAYREMIQQVARAMAGNEVDPVLPFLSSQYSSKHVEMFLDGNFDKRIDVLIRLMPFVSQDEEFENFEEIAIEFAQLEPVGAYAGSAEECDALLDWMQQEMDLTNRQKDVIDCQRRRYEVERLARQNRNEHIRFQELVSLASSLVDEAKTNDSMLLMLNPVHVWSELLSDKYLDEGEQPPATVLYYADDQEVRTGMFAPQGVAYLQKLAEAQPCSFATWAMLSDNCDPDELEGFVRMLIQLRLIAIR